eukprot:Gb_13000 [translate_table: standard]
MRELLDKFEVSKEAKEVYRKEKQQQNACRNIPKFDFSRREYVLNEIKKRNAHNNEDKDSNYKNTTEKFKVEECMAGKNEEEELEYKDPQERDTQEEITEDQNAKPMANEQEVNTLNKAVTVQGKIYEKERLVEESPQQEIMDNEINGRNMASFTPSDFKIKEKEAQYLVKINKKLGQFMEQQGIVSMSPIPSNIFSLPKPNHVSIRARKKHKHKYRDKINKLRQLHISAIPKEKTNLEKKFRVHYSTNGYHEELYMGTKNIDIRHPEGHLEGHAYSPYDEVPIEGKEHFDNKPSNNAEKEQRKDMEWNNKHLHVADALKTMAQQLGLQRMELQGVKNLCVLTTLELNIDETNNPRPQSFAFVPSENTIFSQKYSPWQQASRRGYKVSTLLENNSNDDHSFHIDRGKEENTHGKTDENYVEGTVCLQYKHQCMEWNYNSTQLAVINRKGAFSFHTLNALSQEEEELATKSFECKQKHAWNINWGDDNPDILVVMGKVYMYISQGTKAEETLFCTAYLASPMICKFIQSNRMRGWRNKNSPLYHRHQVTCLSMDFQHISPLITHEGCSQQVRDKTGLASIRILRLMSDRDKLRDLAARTEWAGLMSTIEIDNRRGNTSTRLGLEREEMCAVATIRTGWLRSGSRKRHTTPRKRGDSSKRQKKK